MSKKEIGLSVSELEKLGISIVFPQHNDATAKENARRLAACWNACEGISTENLEYGLPVKELVQQCNEAIQQRDELLDAAIEALEAGQDGDWQSARKALAQSIASVKGGAA